MTLPSLIKSPKSGMEGIFSVLKLLKYLAVEGPALLRHEEMEKVENRTRNRSVLGIMCISNTWMEILPRGCVSVNVMEAHWDLSLTHEHVASYNAGTQRTGGCELKCPLK